MRERVPRRDAPKYGGALTLRFPQTRSPVVLIGFTRVIVILFLKSGEPTKTVKLAKNSTALDTGQYFAIDLNALQWLTQFV
jgi:hypothetical protein